MRDPEPMNHDQMRMLDKLLSDVKDDMPKARPEFLARVAADAAEQAVPDEAPVAKPVKGSSLPSLAQFLAGLGGIPGASLMTASILGGVFLGYAAPEAGIGLLGLETQTVESTDLEASFETFATTDFDLAEGDLLR